jgi:hypothetical protein
MLKNFPPLLVTTAVYILDVPYTNMINAEQRINKYVSALNEWLKLIPELKIVLCDSTGFDWNNHVKKCFNSSNFECLYFTNDRYSVTKYGKGFGELESMNFAVDNSFFIHDSNSFMKVTGKYWVKNINSMTKSSFLGDFKCKSIYSISMNKLLYINTAFFYCSRKFYIENFYHSFNRINDHNGNDLEHVLANVLKENKVKGFQFSILPSICGWSGTVDGPVDLSSVSFRDFGREIKYFILSFFI